MTGIIFASSNDFRLGINKAFLEFDGIRLIDNILSVYKKIFSEIIIVTNDPLSYIEFPKAVVVTDIYKKRKL